MIAYIFDIDGVITNIDTQDVQEFEIINNISNKLINNFPVALITGRSFEWVEKKVLSLMKDVNKNSLFISCEFSGVIVNYKNNEIEKTINRIAQVPNNIVREALLISKKYNNIITHENKKTFLTFRKVTTASLADFQKYQKDFANELSQLISKNKLDSDFVVHCDMLGINVRNKNINKKLAIKEFLNWLKNKTTVQQYLVFGDSISDLEMAEELQNQNLNYKFIYLGENLDNSKYNFPIVKTIKHYDQGTLEYLSQE